MVAGRGIEPRLLAYEASQSTCPSLPRLVDSQGFEP